MPPRGVPESVVCYIPVTLSNPRCKELFSVRSFHSSEGNLFECSLSTSNFQDICTSLFKIVSNVFRSYFFLYMVYTTFMDKKCVIEQPNSE